MRIFFLILIFSSFSLAESPSSTAEGTYCITCNSNSSSPTNTETLKRVAEFQEIMKAGLSCKNSMDADCKLIQWIQSKYSAYATCKDFFADKNGKVGPLAQTIASLIAEDINIDKENSVFLKNNSDFDQYCPGFKEMTPMQKIAFHTWIFELTAFPESTCKVGTKPNTAADVPNGPAVCLYQLELAPSLRTWRSNKFKEKRCAVSAEKILELEGCTGCAFDEFKRHFINTGKPFGTVDANGKSTQRAYWASHNPLTPTKLKLLKEQQACKSVTAKKDWKEKCPGSNEWMAPIKFFGRLGRFPLCKTPDAEKELAGLKTSK